jgi:hypothetical protein
MKEKNETVKTTLKKNKEGYGYKYTELAEINKYCEENGITYTQEIETCEINQKDYIITYVTKDGVTTKHRGCQIVEAVLQGIKNPVMAYGSSITYCRRYSVLMALGLATEDDDAASLTEKREVTKEDAESYVFQFGKHKGKKLIELVEEGSNYIDWLLNNSNDEYLLKCIELLTGQVKPTDEEMDGHIALTLKLQELIVAKDVDLDATLDYYKVDNTLKLSNAQLKELIERLEKR